DQHAHSVSRLALYGRAVRGAVGVALGRRHPQHGAGGGPVHLSAAPSHPRPVYGLGSHGNNTGGEMNTVAELLGAPVAVRIVFLVGRYVTRSPLVNGRSAGQIRVRRGSIMGGAPRWITEAEVVPLM